MNNKKSGTQTNRPSKIGQKLLYRVIRSENKLAAIGDLEEEYDEIAADYGTGKANRWYWKHILRSVIPFLFFNLYWRISLVRSFVITTYRTMQRNRLFSVINIFGLSVGLACTILIYLWINDELNVDKFHENDKRIFQVLIHRSSPNGIETSESTQGLLAQSLAEEMPEVEYSTPVIPPSSYDSTNIVSVEDIRIKARGQYVGKGFFNIFSYALLHGDRDRIFTDKYSVILSDELAEKLFNSTENIIGKTIFWNQILFSAQYVVSGVFAKNPVNSTARFDILFNYELFLEKYPKMSHWGNTDPLTYILLKNGTNIEEFNAKISGFTNAKLDWLDETLFIKRYSDRYLYGKYENGVCVGGRISYIKLLSVIAVFILVIACINFMNLSTAQSSKRMKEVGIRKTVGATRKSLALHYAGEALMMAFLSLFIASLIVIFLLPAFNRLTGKELTPSLDVKVVLSILSITLFTGLVSGSYPALYLSGFHPVAVLKGKIRTSPGEMWIRKGLVIFQFSLSVLLIVSVLVVYKQMDLVKTKNLGYSRDNIITFPMGLKMTSRMETNEKGEIEKEIDSFLQRVKTIPGVINASNFWNDITDCQGRTDGIEWEGKTEDISFACIAVGYDFIDTLGIEMKEGRTFSREFGSDKVNIILNKTAQERMGLADPVGKPVTYWGKSGRIIGVTQNFHFKSFYENVGPLFFYLNLKHLAANIMVKIESGRERETLDRLEKFYKEYNKGLPFEFRFLDDVYRALYEAEGRIAVLSRYSAAIAVLISCLGLFGLTGFTVERRRKEIGIRKVIGANELNIFLLLSGDFTKLVTVAILIALPIGFVVARNWLDRFAYRIDLEVWYFACAALATLFIAWLTVGIQTLKAAKTDPIEVLQYE